MHACIHTYTQVQNAEGADMSRVMVYQDGHDRAAEPVCVCMCVRVFVCVCVLKYVCIPVGRDLEHENACIYNRTGSYIHICDTYDVTHM